MILHLGMSGSLQVVPRETPAGKHDHVDLVLDSGMIVRLTDPRRFGAVLWAARIRTPTRCWRTRPGTAGHRVRCRLAARPYPRPQCRNQDCRDGQPYRGRRGQHLRKRIAVSRRHPSGTGRRQGFLLRCEKLVCAIRETLTAAIDAGGSTLRDYVGAEGRPGYFQQTYFVYGRRASLAGCAASHQGLAPGTALDLLLPALPALDTLALPIQLLFVGNGLTFFP